MRGPWSSDSVKSSISRKGVERIVMSIMNQPRILSFILKNSHLQQLSGHFIVVWVFISLVSCGDMGMCDPLLFVSRHCTVCLFVCSRHRVPPQRHSLLTVWIPKQESAQQREGIWVSPGNNGSISQNLWSTYLSNTDSWFISRKRPFLQE